MTTPATRRRIHAHIDAALQSFVSRGGFVLESINRIRRRYWHELVEHAVFDAILHEERERWRLELGYKTGRLVCRHQVPMCASCDDCQRELEQTRLCEDCKANGSLRFGGYLLDPSAVPEAPTVHG